MFDQINHDLLPIKAHYFLFNTATGPIVRFLPTLAKQLGFSGTLVGIVYAILPLSGLIVKPFIGNLADKFKLHRTLLVTFQVILAVAFFTINFIPSVEPSLKSILVCNGVTFMEVCSKMPFTPQEIEIMDNVTKGDASCHLSCKVTIENAKAICDSWHYQKYCTIPNPDNKSHTNQLVENLEFEAHFNESYDLRVGKCLNIRVFDAYFPVDASKSDSQKSEKAICSQTSFRIPCRARCPKVPSLHKLIKDLNEYEETEPHLFSSYNYQWFLWVSVIGWISMAVISTVGDTICLNLLGNFLMREFGKQKVWGSIAVGIFGICTGYFIDIFSRGCESKNYSCVFYIMLITIILDIMVTFTFKKSDISNSNDPSIFWELSFVLKENKVLVFAWWCIGVGMCTGVIWNFLFWYIEDVTSLSSEKEWLKTLQGLLIGIQYFFGEIPFNFISSNLLRKVGHINVMSLVLLVYAIRFMAFSLFSNMWIFLIFELLHGPSYGLYWPTMVSYGDKIAPSGTKATTEGLGAVFESIGVSLGSLICGFLMQEYRGVTALRVFSVGALVWLSIFWILQLLLQKAKAYPLQQGHTHLASYVPPEDDAVIMTMSQEMQSY